MPGISLSNFFKEKREASEIKSEILNEYFKAWAAIILKGQKFRTVQKILYLDLFSGPGLYKDGTPSTPIKILNSIYSSKGTFVDYNEHVQTIFNDKDKKLVSDLSSNILNLAYYNDLKYKPIVYNDSANIDIIKDAFKENLPSLTFIDPLGYGFTQEMLMHTIKSWGSDLFMLFNFNRIRAALVNSRVEQNMVEIFGEYLGEIREFYRKELSPQKREVFIINTFQKIFEDKGYMTLYFRINFPDRDQTSHYLFFISKVKLAITRAKEIMSKYSDFQEDGIPYFGANLNIQPVLDAEMNIHSINKLAKSLYSQKNDYNGLSLEDIYLAHNHKTNYIKPNYKDALINLHDASEVYLLDKSGVKTSKITYTAKVFFK
ncbi:three-Cys-motif partner protein TcmP [Algoriphagus yeomjeoni]|uniref:Three-Cys-motif partner protein n=1 Tax=Algoriphagus yeomjeoni TaxID=291403 RepID=A0A327PCC7_9BACT|nr:three-Cys-motif partner protein TcmP [Algoriphagus yeomjeoni]RAI89888.1 three-Cys-motif partner protein [Algoriphagus yeomjeoni]